MGLVGIVLDSYLVYASEWGESRHLEVVVEVCGGQRSSHISSHSGERGNNPMQRINDGPVVWAKIEDYKVVGSIMPYAA